MRCLLDERRLLRPPMCTSHYMEYRSVIIGTLLKVVLLSVGLLAGCASSGRSEQVAVRGAAVADLRERMNQNQKQVLVIVHAVTNYLLNRWNNHHTPFFYLTGLIFIHDTGYWNIRVWASKSVYPIHSDYHVNITLRDWFG